MIEGNKVIAIIVAAGRGKRLGSSLPKQFLKIRGRTVLEMAILAFEKNGAVDEIIIAANPDYMVLTEEICRGFSKISAIVPGGDERQDSVAAALSRVQDEESIVLVHDGARPFVTDKVINAVIQSACKAGATVPVVPVKDTIRQISDEGSATLDRACLAAVQTPQAFRASILREAIENARKSGFCGTDDASLAENLGINISMVRGDAANRKITTREDLETEMRIGTGYDVHRLVEGRKLILCGVDIPHEKGLLGHSDADVALHALMDAMLGAAGMGDIGRHFPDTDEKYRGISSLKLLLEVASLLREEGYSLGNADITIIAQRPKIAMFIPKMQENIARTLGCSQSQINIKGTTTEKLGFAGREEGIASEAVCILYRN